MSDPRELLDAYAAKTEWSAESLADVRRDEEAPLAFAALRAVLELHRTNSKVPDQWSTCGHCNDCNGDSRPWPCPTVQAITEELKAAVSDDETPTVGVSNPGDSEPG